MNSTRISEPVLLIGNNRGDLDVLQQIFRPMCSNFAVERDDGKFFDAWRRQCPKVLLLCFEPMNDASAAYLSLLRKSESSRLGQHQALLMCNAEDAREACRLALDAVVDDFAVFKPLQFPELLALKLQQAVARADRVAGFKRLAAMLRESSESMVASMALWQSLLAKSDASLEGVERQSEMFLRQLSSLPDAPTEDYGKALSALKRDANRLANNAQDAVAGMVSELRAELDNTFDPMAARLAANARAAITVAIVDDEEPVRRVLASITEEAGFSVVTCDSGQSLLALGSRQVPDVVLMDINLPDLNGVDLTGQLKSSPSFKDVPFIMCSGLAYEEVVKKSKAAGAAGFVVKPFAPKALVTKIEAVLSQRVRITSTP